MTLTMPDLKKIVELFAIEGEVKEIKPLGNGLINDTYKVVTEGNAPDYVLQRINNAIFTDVDLLQSNIEAVTRHIRKKLEAAGEDDIDRKVLRFIPLKSEGEKVEVLMSEKPKTYCLEDGKYWRVSVFIDNAYTYETVNPEYSGYAGEAFGAFEAMLADIPDTLGETIPDFHNMELRLRQLVEAVREDKAGVCTPTTRQKARNCTRFWRTSTSMESRCARPSSCTVRANCLNGSATATQRSTT